MAQKTTIEPPCTGVTTTPEENAKVKEWTEALEWYAQILKKYPSCDILTRNDAAHNAKETIINHYLK